MKYNRMYTPEKIDTLKRQIFVFGSNIEGHHAGGAARTARKKFGAINGQGVGLQGNSYAIPTMSLSLADIAIKGSKEAAASNLRLGIGDIKKYVDEFIAFAIVHTEMTFFVTRIGCGIAGYDDSEIAPLFLKALEVENIHLPESFVREIDK